jgi:hypothetical protein
MCNDEKRIKGKRMVIKSYQKLSKAIKSYQKLSKASFYNE